MIHELKAPNIRKYKAYSIAIFKIISSWPYSLNGLSMNFECKKIKCVMIMIITNDGNLILVKVLMIEMIFVK